MRTNIEIDDELMAQALTELGVKTKREAVERGLQDALHLVRQAKAIESLWGMGWEGDLDSMRTSKHVPTGE